MARPLAGMGALLRCMEHRERKWVARLPVGVGALLRFECPGGRVSDRCGRFIVFVVPGVLFPGDSAMAFGYGVGFIRVGDVFKRLAQECRKKSDCFRPVDGYMGFDVILQARRSNPFLRAGVYRGTFHNGGMC